MMTLTEKLIGAQLISIDDSAIVIRKNNKVYTLIIDDSDEGDCCGYNEIKTNLYISREEINRNPIITNVIITGDEGGCSEQCLITFFGESKPMAELYSESGSGSGWGYGACVEIKCLQTTESWIITSW